MVMADPKRRLKRNLIAKKADGVEEPYRRPTPTIESLFNDAVNNKAYETYLLNLRSRASVVASAAVLGIAPSTLKKWMARGKAENDGYYSRFYNESVVAISTAVVEAEIAVSTDDPKWFLTRGMGRFLHGDLYNITKDDGTNNYNIDGTISPNIDDSTSFRDTDVAKIDDKSEQQDDVVKTNLGIQALIELRKSGVDLNDMVDQKLEMLDPGREKNDD